MKLLELLYSLLPARDLGRRGEAAAARFLKRQGLRILQSNWRARGGEIDLIALEGEVVVFVEVKSRTMPPGEARTGEMGTGLEKIDFRKAESIRRAALAWMNRVRSRRPLGELRCRLDGVVVEFTRGPLGRPFPASIRWHPDLHPLDREG